MVKRWWLSRAVGWGLIVAALVGCAGAAPAVQAPTTAFAPVPTTAFAPAPTTAFAPTASAAPTVTAVPDATATPAVTAVAPTATARPASLGSGYNVAISEPAAPGEVRIFEHHPQNMIQYDRLDLDDALVAVTHVCYETREDVTSWFTRESDPAATSEVYASWPFAHHRSGCWLEFVVENVTGDTIGLALQAHCPVCH